MAWRSKNNDPTRSLRDEFLLKLTRREHSAHELRIHAKRKGYPADEIDPVLEEFLQRDWVNDQRFAEAMCRHKLLISKWAPGRIVQLLRTKGIPAALAESSVRKYAPADLSDSMEDTLRKKVSAILRESDPRKRKKKVVDYLFRKGYPPDAVFENADRLMKTFHL